MRGIDNEASRSGGGDSQYTRRWPIKSWLSAVIVICAMLGAQATAEAAVLTMTGDESQSSPEVGLGRSTADALASTLNDPFAYDPLSPTSPLPFQVINTNADALKGYNGAEFGPISVAYVLDAPADGLFFDLYGRNNCCFERDNDLTIELFNGDWTTPVSTTTGFTIADAFPYAGRFTAPADVLADRVRITGPNFFTLMEIRANGDVIPEPTSFAFLGIVASSMLLRRRKAI